jgi:uncharacterized membrane protein
MDSPTLKNDNNLSPPDSNTDESRDVECLRKNTFTENRLTPEITDFLNGSVTYNSENVKKDFASQESFTEERILFLEPEKFPFPSKVYNDPVEIHGDIERKEKSIDKNYRKYSIVSRKNTGWQSYMGLVLTLISGLMFAIMGLIVKYLKEYHAMNLGFFRFTGMLLPAIPFLLYVTLVQKKSVLEPIWPLTQKKQLKTMSVLFVSELVFFLSILLMCKFSISNRYSFFQGRAFVGCIAVIAHFYAIQYMTVADAMVIGSCSPVFVTFVAHLFLGEKCGIFPVVAGLLTIVGVAVIARPPMLTGEEEFDTDTLVKP